MGKTAGLISIAVMLLMHHAGATETRSDSIPRLPTVHIRSRGAGVHIRQDTIEYLASAYKGPEVRKVQDLLARLEGFSVSPDGHVHFNGQEIETILVNGVDMAGSNYRLLSRYLRAGLVKQVQLIRNYDPDPLMHELRRSGKIGLSLVLHDSLTRTLSGGVDLGESLAGRKDMDLHLLDLHGPGKLIALGSWNRTGITATNNRDFYAREEGHELGESEENRTISPVSVGIIHPPALPDPYVRENNDRTASVIWKRSLAKGRRVGFIMGLDGMALSQTQDRASHYVLPDGNDWAMREQEWTKRKGNGLFLRSEYLADRGRNGRTQVWVDMNLGRTQDFHQDALSGAVVDGLKEWNQMVTAGVQGHLRRSRRMRHGAMCWEADLGWQREWQMFDVMSERLDIPGLDSGRKRMEQQWQASAWQQDIAMRWVPVRSKHAMGWKLRYEGREGNRSAVCGQVDGHAGLISYLRQTINLEAEGERKADRHSRWYWSGAAGGGIWRYGADMHTQATPIHDLQVGFESRPGPFKGWSLSYRDIRALPDEQYVLPVSLLTGRCTIISSQVAWKPNIAHQLDFRYTVRSITSGRGMLFLISYARHENEVMQAWEMKPGSTRITPMSSGRSEVMQGNLNGDLYLSAARIKLSGDLHFTTRRGKALVNGWWSDREQHNAGFGLRASSSWRSVFNLEAAWNCDNSVYRDRSKAGVQDFSSWSNTLRLKLRARWQERLFAAVTMERYSMPGLPAFLATDIFISWQCHERLGFSLTGHNLLDRRRSVTNWVTAGAEGATVFRVVPGYLLWKLSWAI